MKTTMLAIFIMVLAASILNAQPPTDVAPDHWSYQAVEKLADSGIVLGYPDGSFMGDRTLTRYEMAVIIARILDTLDNMQDMIQFMHIHMSKVVDASLPGGPVTSEDIEVIRKLVDEYKVELTVIGTDMARVNQQLNDLQNTVMSLQSDVDSLKEVVTEPEGPIHTAIADVSRLRKIRFSGYVQARYELAENADDGSSENTFFVRRARVKVTANPTKQTTIVIQPDITEDVTLKDAYVNYVLGDNNLVSPSFTFGQFNWPFGYEALESSSVRETPERSIVVQRLLTGERDQGLKFSGSLSGPLLWQVGIFNGTGANTKDNNREKDIVGQLRYAVRPNLDLGVSAYVGTAFVPATDTDPAFEQDKNRWGADFQYYLTDTTIKGEWIWGEDGSVDSNGGYLQLARNIGARYVSVVKYETYDPDDAVDDNELTRWHLGVIRYLNANTNLKFFYEINDNEGADEDNNIFRAEIVARF